MLALSALLSRYEHYIFKADVFGRSFVLASFSQTFHELHLQLPHDPLIVILIIIAFFQALILATEELVCDLIVLLSLLSYGVHRLVVDAEDLGPAPLSIFPLGECEDYHALAEVGALRLVFLLSLPLVSDG